LASPLSFSPVALAGLIEVYSNSSVQHLRKAGCTARGAVRAPGSGHGLLLLHGSLLLLHVGRWAGSFDGTLPHDGTCHREGRVHRQLALDRDGGLDWKHAGQRHRALNRQRARDRQSAYSTARLTTRMESEGGREREIGKAHQRWESSRLLAWCPRSESGHAGKLVSAGWKERRKDAGRARERERVCVCVARSGGRTTGRTPEQGTVAESWMRPSMGNVCAAPQRGTESRSGETAALVPCARAPRRRSAPARCRAECCPRSG
jgi:hypothetical protein